MPNIHFYDTDNGYVHYVSDIIPKLECRVYDAVRKIEDAFLDQEAAVQFILDRSEHLTTHQKIQEQGQSLLLEAVVVSKKGLRFMDNVMKNSPLRDNDAWLNEAEGRALFMSQRQQRLNAWRGL